LNISSSPLLIVDVEVGDVDHLVFLSVKHDTELDVLSIPYYISILILALFGRVKLVRATGRDSTNSIEKEESSYQSPAIVIRKIEVR